MSNIRVAFRAFIIKEKSVNNRMWRWEDRTAQFKRIRQCGVNIRVCEVIIITVIYIYSRFGCQYGTIKQPSLLSLFFTTLPAYCHSPCLPRIHFIVLLSYRQINPSRLQLLLSKRFNSSIIKIPFHFIISFFSSSLSIYFNYGTFNFLFS